MNRIDEIRRSRGLTRAQLAELCGTSEQTISRLVSGSMQLTLTWMHKIAAALECDVADMLVSGTSAGTTNDVRPMQDDRLPSIAEAIGVRGLRPYDVLAGSVAEAGIRAGHVIVVDETAAAIEARKAGDILLVRSVELGVLMLRQFLPPALLVTNRTGPSNAVLKLNDPSLVIEIVGVVLRS